MDAISVSGLTKRYGAMVAVKDVDLTVAEGEALAVIGPNGAGKSTLFGSVAGEHVVTDGRIELFGRDVTRWRAQRLARSGVARTFQVARLFHTMTAKENVAVARCASNSAYRRAFRPFTAYLNDPHVEEVMHRVGLHDGAARRASSLSQGDRKRLELAMALVQDPKVLLLDEPTAGMGAEDIPRTIQLLRSLKEHGAREGLSILITAHDMEVVFSVADRVVLMANGQVVLDGSPREVREHPRTREIYLGEPTV